MNKTTINGLKWKREAGGGGWRRVEAGGGMAAS